MIKVQRLSAILILILACTACAKPKGSPGALPDIEPGQRPSLDSVEAGLWMHMDLVEKNLRTSGRLVTDDKVNTYVRDIVCRLAGPYCGDIRVYVVETPHFNASMAPNGMMEVWTGLILRSENEAQLAYVLGHEIGHYLRRHSLQIWRDVRLKSDLLMYFGLLTAAAGYGYAGNLGQIAVMGSIFAFSRDNEREADELGFELMVKAGYDPREAAKIWKGLIDERNASEASEPFIFFSTHPPTQERIQNLTQMADEAIVGGRPLTTGAQRFSSATRRIRPTLLEDELHQREFKRSQVVLNRLFDAGDRVSELYYFQGELYRLRGQEGDREAAITAYRRALDYSDPPPEVYERLGLLLSKDGKKDKARVSYERYLEVKPDADDREMIRALIQQLK